MNCPHLYSGVTIQAAFNMLVEKKESLRCLVRQKKANNIVL